MSLTFVLVADGEADPQTFRPEMDESQWCVLRRARVLCVFPSDRG